MFFPLILIVTHVFSNTSNRILEVRVNGDTVKTFPYNTVNQTSKICAFLGETKFVWKQLIEYHLVPDGKYYPTNKEISL